MRNPNIDNSEDLTGLPQHRNWQQMLVDMIHEGGVAPAEATEAMFTVALANKLRLDGHRPTAAMMLRVTVRLIEALGGEAPTAH